MDLTAGRSAALPDRSAPPDRDRAEEREHRPAGPDRQGLQQDGGATDVTALDRVQVAGGETSHLTAGFSAQGVASTIDQYYLTHDGQTYVVTFSTNSDESQSERDALAGSVLVTWEWA